MTEKSALLVPEPDGPGGAGWSWLCAACAFQRGMSYLIRPPETGTRTENVIEHFVPYQAWGWIIVALAVAIAVGMLTGMRLMEIAGHIAGAAVYVLLGLSVVLSALFLGQPWAAAGALLFIASVHMARVAQVAKQIRTGKRR